MEALQPYMHWIIFAGIGLIAGWLAGLLLGGGGLIRNLIIGIIGALVGGALVRNGLLPLPAEITDVTSQVWYGTEIFIATVGAIIIVVLARIIAR